MVLTDKHKHILHKAEELFALRGFEGTTVRDIAALANVNLAMISYYFGSKEKLIEQLFSMRFNDGKLDVEGVVTNSSLQPLQKIEFIIDKYIDRVFDNNHFYKVMVKEQMQNKNKNIIAFIGDLKKHYSNIISQIITEGRRTGHFTKEVDVVLLHSTLTGTVLQTMMNQDYFAQYHKLGKTANAAVKQVIKEKLSVHVKAIFKLILGYEEQ